MHIIKSPPGAPEQKKALRIATKSRKVQVTKKGMSSQVVTGVARKIESVEKNSLTASQTNVPSFYAE